MSEELDFENMSDEEFQTYADEHPVTEEENTEEDSLVVEEPEHDIQEDVEDDIEVENEEEEEEEEEETEEVLEDTDTKEEPEEVTEETNEDTQETSDSEEDTGEENSQLSDEKDFDYKAGYSDLMAPIKANGHEIQIKSPEDLRKLVQMGLNYDEKMVSIKPVRLAGKALERAGIIKDGIIDENALNRMIDFNNGNIDVMKERLKELEIDPLDLDLEDVDYQAQDHMVSEHNIALEDIQRELDNRGTTEQVITAISTMDQGSKDYFNANPDQLLSLEQDIANGVFDEINGNVQYERRMGRLGNKTNMEAYIEFAQARGEMLRENETAPQQPTKKVNTKKRAKAAGSKPIASKTSEAVNPFDLSDEEFEKQFGTIQALR